MPTPRSSFGFRNSVRDEPAAALMALSFWGTTEETTIAETLRPLMIRRMTFAVSLFVGCRIGFSIRFLLANAAFTYELLMSTRRYSVCRFLAAPIPERH